MIVGRAGVIPIVAHVVAIAPAASWVLGAHFARIVGGDAVELWSGSHWGFCRALVAGPLPARCGAAPSSGPSGSAFVTCSGGSAPSAVALRGSGALPTLGVCSARVGHRGQHTCVIPQLAVRAHIVGRVCFVAHTVGSAPRAATAAFTTEAAVAVRLIAAAVQGAGGAVIVGCDNVTATLPDRRAVQRGARASSGAPATIR